MAITWRDIGILSGAADLDDYGKRGKMSEHRESNALAERVNTGGMSAADMLTTDKHVMDMQQQKIAELEAEIRATEEAGVAGIRQWVEAAWKAEARIAELEAQIRDAGDYAEKLQIECSELEARLKEACGKIEHQRYWYGCRSQRLQQFAKEEMTETQQKRFFNIMANGTADPTEPPTYAQQYNMLKHRAEKAEARLKVAEGEAKADRKTLGEEITHWFNEFEKAEAEAGRLRAALEEIAKGDYKCDDWICDAPAMAQTALDELAGLGHERGREK